MEVERDKRYEERRNFEKKLKEKQDFITHQSRQPSRKARKAITTNKISKYLYHENQLRHGVTGKFCTSVRITELCCFFVF